MSDTKVARYLIDHAKDLKLKVTDGAWTKEWLPEYSHVQVEITIGGNRLVGCAMDSSKDLAFIKAGTEALERAYCAEHNIHSNGVAAHPDKAQAMVNAKHELLERDLFLCHFLTKTPYGHNIEESVLDQISYCKIAQKLKTHGIEIKLLKLSAKSDEFGFVCLSTGNNDNYRFSSIIGLGYSGNETEAAGKALHECLASTVYHILHHQDINPITKDQFLKQDLHTPGDHKSLYLGGAYKGEIQDILKNSAIKSISRSEHPISFEFEKLFSADNLLSKAPVQVYRAMSADLQPMYYGPTTNDKVNLRRINNFTGKLMGADFLRYTPHCIG